MPIVRETIFSQDLVRTYRYTLWRQWGDQDAPFLQFIGLNPSTADENQDDHTVRRCKDFAKSWGFTALCMTNLFAFRGAHPDILKTCADPVGPDNDTHLFRVASEAKMVVAIWGSTFENWPALIERKRIVYEQIPELSCIALTAGNHPKHPIGSLKSTMPQIYHHR